MIRNFLKSKLIKVLLLYFTFYFIQFIVIPIIFGKNLSDNQEDFILISSWLLLSSILVFFVTTNTFFWIIGILFYDLLIYAYNCDGYYGIGYFGILGSSEFSYEFLMIHLVFITIAYLIIQLIILIVINIIIYFKNKFLKKYD